MAAALALVASRAFAGEVILFEGEDFQGGSMVIGNTAPNLDDTGFNDRAASISVRDGTWEVCSDADFRGACAQLSPGDYPRLDPPFNRSISSLRQVAAGGEYGAYPGPGVAPQVSLGAGVGVGVAGLTIGVDLPAYPELVPIPGYPVYYAPRIDSNYFFYDGMYWVYQRDNWYASSWYNGPWGLVGPEAVPLFLLRVPVRYYRHPPDYFRGWSSDAPPRWGDHWGNSWTQSHRGWDRWNRNAVPAPAPLPGYQRQYAGDRYPTGAQQRTLQSRNYRYQPRDSLVRQHFQAQQGAAPVSRGPQRPPPGTGQGQRPVIAAPPAQGRSLGHEATPPRQGMAQRPRETRRVEQPAAQQPAQGAVQRQQEVRRIQPQAQQPRQGAAQHQEQARTAPGQARERQGNGPARETRQGQEQRGGRGE